MYNFFFITDPVEYVTSFTDIAHWRYSEGVIIIIINWLYKILLWIYDHIKQTHNKE